MKKLILTAVVIVVAVLWAQVVLAGSLQTAQDWENNAKTQEVDKNYAGAATAYMNAAGEYMELAIATEGLRRKAELQYEAGRCRLKAGNISFINALIADIRSNSPQHGKVLVDKLLVQLEEFAWTADGADARYALQVVLTEKPSRGPALLKKAVAKNRKDLVYWLNPELLMADCKAERAKALRAASTAEVANKLAASRDMCSLKPSQTEHQAFSARADAEPDTLAALPLYQQIKATWEYLNQAAIDRLVTYGRKIRVIEGNEAMVENIRKLLPDAIVKDKLPREVPHPAGIWQLLKTRGGERCPWLVAPTVAGNVEFQSNGCNYTIVLDDGRRYNIKNADDINKFKNRGDDIRNFYVVAAPVNEQPANLPDGVCMVGIQIDGR